MAKLLVTQLAQNGDVTQYNTVDNEDEDGAAITWAANTNHEFRCTGKEIIVVNKGSTNATCTIETRSTYNVHGLDPEDRTFTITANQTEIIPPFDAAPHVDASGYANIQFSHVTGLEVAIFRLP